MKTFFFFLETTWFWAEKTFEFPISGEKSLSISVKTLFFVFFVLETTWFWAEKTFEFPISAEKSLSISVKTLFFSFFWRPPDFGRKKRLNFRFRAKNHSQFRWRHPNFWGCVLKIFIIPPHQNFLDPPLPGAHEGAHRLQEGCWLQRAQQRVHEI